MDNGPKSASKNNKIKWVLLAIITVIIGGSGTIIYLQNSKFEKKLAEKTDQITKLEAKIKENSKQQEDSKSSDKSTNNTAENNNTDTQSCKSPDNTQIENIIASVTTENTQALVGYMATPVSVVLAASDGIGDRTPDQATSDISSFISDTYSWSFNLPQSMTDPYRKGFYAKYFPNNAVIGKSNNEKVISFSFNCDGKISTVFLSSDASLLLN